MKPFCLLLACIAWLQGCQDSQSANATYDLPKLVTELAGNARANLAFIEGGTFVMGDFGDIGEDGVWRPYFPPTAEQNQAHEVTLSSYSLSKDKISWREFDTYLLANDLPLIERGLSKTWERSPFEQDPDSRLFVEKPARVTWQDARNYCQWLGSLTDLPMDLPTSAQWEFAGRNRGSKEWIYSTHDGQPLSTHPELSKRVSDTGKYVPVGTRLPPNPLGIYDMADNGMEWVNDWFSETWYRENPEITDPQGPAEGREKIVRNMDFSFSRIGMPESLPSAFNEEWDSVSEYTFRCALQSPTPLADGDQ